MVLTMLRTDNWWKGIHHETANGYGMVNLYDDGSFDNEYVPYGWNAG